ncbi:ABC transporter ATP-binding protein [Phytohabitans kaempferiae]|uniref:ABC transporter ATP-binding protein n=1 Tax=Phytohabitans kaempferiae TaxID=1620943 RepID=A0ABV6M6U8_9ACTN
MTTVDKSAPDTQAEASGAGPLLSLRDVHTHFPVRGGVLRRTVGHVRAVDGVDLEVRRGETLGLVGESGCGKSTLGRTILRLIPPTSGQIHFDGTDLTRLRPDRMKAMRRHMQLIFQDPVGSLNPRMTVRNIIGEALLAHGVRSRQERHEQVRDIMQSVGLDPDAGGRYPHEFSGGQRQRVGIARALVLRPRFIVADEPVSALDVSIQSQVLNLLVDLKRRFALTYLFVAHDLAVVDYVSDRVAVMYLGKVVEIADSVSIRERPLHPYTVALLSAIPQPRPGEARQRIVLAGDVPSPLTPPSGCRFRTRCPIARQICTDLEPPLESKAPGHSVACHFSGEMGATA